jgi:hypothetical protein
MNSSISRHPRRGRPDQNGGQNSTLADKDDLPPKGLDWTRHQDIKNKHIAMIPDSMTFRMVVGGTSPLQETIH